MIKKFFPEPPSVDYDFGISVTGRCNFKCDFCSREMLQKTDMRPEDFKELITKLKEYGIKKEKALNGKKITICIGGGEPMLNPHIVEMTAFAVKTLGRENVQLTTNLSMFPNTGKETEALLRAMGLPKINVSLDYEHLKFLKDAIPKIIALRKAVIQTRTNLIIINVAKNKRQFSQPWPKEIRSEIKLLIKIAGVDRRKERLSDSFAGDIIPSGRPKEMQRYLRDVAGGKKRDVSGWLSIALGINLVSYPGMEISIDFAPDGRAYFWPRLNGLFFPQLAIGNWKKESIEEILEKNLPYKHNMLRPWIGLRRFSGKTTKNGKPVVEKAGKEKRRLLAKVLYRQIARLRRK